MTSSIIYEQPLSEITRACLRLEYLFDKIAYNKTDPASWKSKSDVESILAMAHLLDRPDLKTRITKMLTKFITNLKALQQIPGVDQDKLAEVLNTLAQSRHYLISHQGNLATPLRQDEFLNTLHHHLAAPGAGCSFDSPLFHHWLAAPYQTRQQTIAQWLEALRPIQSIVNSLLTLIRESAQGMLKESLQGFYHENLDAQKDYQLIRIDVAQTLDIYPEFSVGKQRFSVRFCHWEKTQQKPVPYADNLQFTLTLCHL